LGSGSVIRYEHKDDYEWIRIIDLYPENHRYLHFETSIQGAIDLRDHHQPVFEYIGLMDRAARDLCASPGKILIGGLGSCTLLHAVSKTWPGARTISIEHNSRVLELAKRFFRLEPRAKVLIGDLRHRLETGRKLRGFDLILIDCYTATSIPPHLTSIELIQLLRDTLSEDGVVVFNLWDKNCNELCGDQVRTLLEVFGEIALLECREDQNLVVSARRQKGRTWPEHLTYKGHEYPLTRLRTSAQEAWPAYVREARVVTDDNLGELFGAIGMVI